MSGKKSSSFRPLRLFVASFGRFSTSIQLAHFQVAQVLLLQRVPPHPHVIRYHTAFVDAQSAHFYIVMEYAENGDLETLINALRVTNRYLHEDVIWRYLLQLCAGLQHLHNKRIVHRDVRLCQPSFPFA